MRNNAAWAHFRRDVKDLVAQSTQDADLARWAQQLRHLYRAARDRPPASARLRLAKRRRLEERTTRRCELFVDTAVPQRLLCQRAYKYLSELDTFITDPRVPRPTTRPSAPPSSTPGTRVASTPSRRSAPFSCPPTPNRLAALEALARSLPASAGMRRRPCIQTCLQV